MILGSIILDMGHIGSILDVWHISPKLYWMLVMKAL